MAFFTKLRAAAQICRPLNFVITFAAVVVAEIICSKNNLQLSGLISAPLSAGFTASAGNIINDIFDIDIDRINRPERILPSGRLKIPEARFLYWMLMLLAFLFSLYINLSAVIIVILSNLLLFFYSYSLKKVPLAGNFSVALLTGAAFIYGGAAVNNPADAVIPASFAFLINMVREIVKDMEDVKGDSDSGIITFPQRYGFGAAKKAIILLSLFLIALTVYPFIFKLYRIEYFIMVMLIVNPVMIFVLKSIFENDSRRNLNKLSFILKLNMIIGLTAIYLGR